MKHNDPTLHSTLHWIAANGNASKELRRDAKATQAHVDDATALHALIVDDNTTTNCCNHTQRSGAKHSACNENTYR